MVQHNQQTQLDPQENDQEFEIRKIDSKEWSSFAEDAHRCAFGEYRPAYQDRIDYALLAINPNGSDVYGYATIHELDAESVYLQLGGLFENCKKRHRGYRIYVSFIEQMRARYKRISTYVSNKNISYLKLAMHFGFRISGVKMYKSNILVELTIDVEDKNAF